MKNLTIAALVLLTFASIQSAVAGDFYFTPEFVSGDELMAVLKSNNVNPGPQINYTFVLGLSDPSGNDFGVDVGPDSDLRGAAEKAAALCEGSFPGINLLANPHARVSGAMTMTIQQNLTLKNVCSGGVISKIQNFPYPTDYCRLGASSSALPACVYN